MQSEDLFRYWSQSPPLEDQRTLADFIDLHTRELRKARTVVDYLPTALMREIVECIESGRYPRDVQIVDESEPAKYSNRLPADLSTDSVFFSRSLRTSMYVEGYAVRIRLASSSLVLMPARGTFNLSASDIHTVSSYWFDFFRGRFYG